MTITSWVQEVTPEQAAEWLAKKPTRQRRIARPHVERLKKQLHAGAMSIVPQAFLFEEETGGLMDGQHRLTAIVETGIGLDAAVIVSGVPADKFESIDSGKRRDASQFVNAPNYTMITAAARYYLSYKTNPAMVDLPALLLSRTIQEVVEVAEGNERLQHFARRATNSAKSWKGPISIVAAIATLADEKGQGAQVEEWLDGLQTGAGLGVGDPRIPLRNHFLSGGGKGMGKRAKWGMVVKCWNAYVTGIPRASISFKPGNGFNPGENMPEIA